tara:strand:- start:41 stop:298 length:258 start_codon:yes stop_codon:yes gene_type:complete
LVVIARFRRIPWESVLPVVHPIPVVVLVVGVALPVGVGVGRPVKCELWICPTRRLVLVRPTIIVIVGIGVVADSVVIGVDGLRRV